MYQVSSIEWEGGEGPDGFSNSSAVYVSLISTTSGTTQGIGASLKQSQHEIRRELYDGLSHAYGLTPQEVVKMVRFKQGYIRDGDGKWGMVRRFEVKKNGQEHSINIKPHDLEATIAAMVNAFNHAVSQSGKHTH